MDQPTYTTSQYTFVNEPQISSIIFTQGRPFNIDGRDYTLQQAQQKLGPRVIKGLLDPVLYKTDLKKYFSKMADLREPPSDDDYRDDDRDYYDR